MTYLNSDSSKIEYTIHNGIEKAPFKVKRNGNDITTSSRQMDSDIKKDSLLENASKALETIINKQNVYVSSSEKENIIAQVLEEIQNKND